MHGDTAQVRHGTHRSRNRSKNASRSLRNARAGRGRGGVSTSELRPLFRAPPSPRALIYTNCQKTPSYTPQSTPVIKTRLDTPRSTKNALIYTPGVAHFGASAPREVREGLAARGRDREVQEPPLHGEVPRPEDAQELAPGNPRDLPGRPAIRDTAHMLWILHRPSSLIRYFIRTRFDMCTRSQHRWMFAPGPDMEIPLTSDLRACSATPS